MSYYFPKLKKSSYAKMLDLLEKFNKRGEKSKKLHEQVLNSIVKHYSCRKEKTIAFLTYLTNYHSSRCKHYVSNIENDENDDYFYLINDAIIAHCDESELFSHLWGMFVNGAASQENL